MTAIEKQFHQAMLSIYERARNECNYNATYFLRMVHERGGVVAAKSLLAGSVPQYGLGRLWECHRLDLSVEAHVLKPEFRTLFTCQERAEARRRLKEYRYDAPWDQCEELR